MSTHNRCFPAFAELIGSVEEALATLSQQPVRVKALFGLYLDRMATGELTDPAPGPAPAAA